MRVTVQISNRDLYEAIGVEKDRAVDRAEVERARDKLLAYVADRVHVKNGDADCAPADRALSFTDKGAAAKAKGVKQGDSLKAKCKVGGADANYVMNTDCELM